MNIQHKSIFNLIEIFRQGKTKIINSITPRTHCEQKGIHDFYCDAEKPFVNQ